MILKGTAYNELSNGWEIDTLNMLENRQPFVYKKLFTVIFMAGFLIGILYTNFIGSQYSSHSGIFSSYYLSSYQYIEVVSSELFWFVLQKRLLPVLVIWVMGITVIGSAVVWGVLLWVGFSGGMLVSMAVMQFGFKGLLLTLGGLFPQYLIYVPAMFLFLHKVYAMSKSLYGDKSKAEQAAQNAKSAVFPYALSLLFILIAMLLGVILESYVNPTILNLILKKF